MQRLQVEGAPEIVFKAIQMKLEARGIRPRLVDAASITLLFDMAASKRGPVSTFFLCVVPADEGRSNVALARRRSRKEENLKAMVLGNEDSLEMEVLRDLVGMQTR